MTHVDGHLTEITLSTLADGQDVDASAHEHLEGCEACQQDLAHAILEHVMVDEAMAAASRPAVASAPWSWIAAAAALLLVVRGAPLLETFGRAEYARDLRHLTHGGALFARSLLAQSSLALGLAVVTAATVCVVMLATWVAPRERA